MIIGILAIVGVPLWLIAIVVIALLRARSKARGIPGSFLCKLRVVSGEVAGLDDSFARYQSVGQWVHKVLVLHGGNPFLIQTMPYGVEGLEQGPVDVPDGTVKRIENPVAFTFRLDAGATLEVVCAERDVEAVRGPFLSSPT